MALRKYTDSRRTGLYKDQKKRINKQGFSKKEATNLQPIVWSREQSSLVAKISQIFDNQIQLLPC